MTFPLRKALFFLIIGATIQSAGAYTISGIVQFTDVNGTISPLPGASVFIDSTHNATTNGSGGYTITGLSGTITIAVSKSQAFSNTTFPISAGDVDDLLINLSYSKGALSTPILANGRITTQYSNNLRPLHLWELPNFVWAATKYENYLNTPNDTWYYTAAMYDGGNQFSINRETQRGNYRLYFVSSDIYNSPTTDWHPFINETRYFNSSELLVQQGDLGIRLAPRSVASRENEMKINVWQVVPLFLICIGMVIIMEKMAARKQGQQKKNWNRRRK